MRIERLRQLDSLSALDRIDLRGSEATSRFLAEVYDSGAMPTTANKWFLTHPVPGLDGTECEGCLASGSADTSRSVPVLVIGSQVPSVGDRLHALAVGGKWVAERGKGSHKATCILPCSPCQIPKKNLTVSWVNTLSGTGSTPLVFSPPGHWNSACANQLLYALSCPAGQSQFSVTYFLTGDCPRGQIQSCTSPGRNPFSLMLVDFTCNPFHLHYRCTVAACVVLGDDGYTDFYIDDPDPSEPPCCQTFKVTGCNNIALSGATATVYDSNGGTQRARGTTDSLGNISLFWVGRNDGSYYVTVSEPSGSLAPYGQTLNLTCGGGLLINLLPADGFHCFGVCGPLPAADTIQATVAASIFDGISCDDNPWLGWLAATLNFDAASGLWKGSAAAEGSSWCGCVGGAATVQFEAPGSIGSGFDILIPYTLRVPDGVLCIGGPNLARIFMTLGCPPFYGTGTPIRDADSPCFSPTILLAQAYPDNTHFYCFKGTLSA